MVDFILKNYTLLTLGIEGLAAISGILVYQKHRGYASRLFVFFVCYVFLIELIGGYPNYVAKYDILEPFRHLITNTPFEQNYWWYTLTWNIGSALFISLFVHKILQNEYYKKLAKYSGIIFLFIAGSLIVFNFNTFFSGIIPSLSFIEGIAILLLLSLYFIDCLQNERINGFRQSFNLIVLGTLFVWWLIVTPIWFFEDYYNSSDLGYIRLRSLFLFLSNFFMYGTFVLAFLFCKPQNH